MLPDKRGAHSPHMWECACPLVSVRVARTRKILGTKVYARHARGAPTGEGRSRDLVGRDQASGDVVPSTPIINAALTAAGHHRRAHLIMPAPPPRVSRPCSSASPDLHQRAIRCKLRMQCAGLARPASVCFVGRSSSSRLSRDRSRRVGPVCHSDRRGLMARSSGCVTDVTDVTVERSARPHRGLYRPRLACPWERLWRALWAVE